MIQMLPKAFVLPVPLLDPVNAQRGACVASKQSAVTAASHRLGTRAGTTAGLGSRLCPAQSRLSADRSLTLLGARPPSSTCTWCLVSSVGGSCLQVSACVASLAGYMRQLLRNKQADVACACSVPCSGQGQRHALSGMADSP